MTNKMLIMAYFIDRVIYIGSRRILKCFCSIVSRLLFKQTDISKHHTNNTFRQFLHWSVLSADLIAALRNIICFEMFINKKSQSTMSKKAVIETQRAQHRDH